MSKNSQLLALWRKTSTNPGGKRLFSRLVCLDAPYFSSIRPLFEVVRPGHVEVTMRKRRAVFDHIGEVHTMAMCNLAELAARTLTEVTLPTTHRWLCSGVTAEYLQKATTDLSAVARARLPVDGAGPSEHRVPVEVRDTDSTLVCHVQITMWITPKHRGSLRQQAPSSRLRNPVFEA